MTNEMDKPLEESEIEPTSIDVTYDQISIRPASIDVTDNQNSIGEVHIVRRPVMYP